MTIIDFVKKGLKNIQASKYLRHKEVFVKPLQANNIFLAQAKILDAEATRSTEAGRFIRENNPEENSLASPGGGDAFLDTPTEAMWTVLVVPKSQSVSLSANVTEENSLASPGGGDASFDLPPVVEPVHLRLSPIRTGRAPVVEPVHLRLSPIRTGREPVVVFP